MMERKRTNFKMYKIGRRWAFACAVILTMGTTTLVARADDERLQRGLIRHQPVQAQPNQSRLRHKL